jgi:hypothetical protein
MAVPFSKLGDPIPAPAGPERPVGSVRATTLGDVALLVDFDNLQLSLKRLFNAAFEADVIVQIAEAYGRLVAGCAYGDWGRPCVRGAAAYLYRRGLKPVFVPSSHAPADPTVKQSADLQLAIDAVDLCWRQPNVRTVVFGTGDGDLLPALVYARHEGRRVVLVGVGAAMNRRLAEAADDVWLYEELVGLPERSPVPGPRTPAA